METKETSGQEKARAGGRFAALVRAVENLRQSAVIGKINRFLDSRSMLAVFAVLALLSNLLGWEIAVYSVTFLLALYAVVFGRDMLILAPIAAFMYITPSAENNPFINSDSFFFPGKGPGLWLAVGFISFFLILFCLRVGTDGGFARFFGVRRRFLLSFLLLGGALLTGGVGYAGYDWRNLYYAVLFFLAVFLLYFILIATVRWEEVPGDYFAWLGLFLSLTVVAQLCNVFVIHADNIFRDGGIVCNYIYTGWGAYTSMSVVMLFGMPGAFFLAATKKHGFVFNISGSLVYLAIVASQGRGSMLMGAVLYVLCAIAVLRKKQNRRGNLIVYGVILLAVIAVAVLFREKIFELISSLFERGDSSRLKLFRDGLLRFRNHPVFGEGFYACPTDDWNNLGGATFIPAFWHNTIIQMLAGCGVIGLAAYLFHRWQTVRLFFLQPSYEKTFIGFSVLAVLLTCLLDCHLFNIGVTLLYSAALAFAEKTGKMKGGKAVPLPMKA